MRDWLFNILIVIYFLIIVVWVYAAFVTRL